MAAVEALVGAIGVTDSGEVSTLSALFFGRFHMCSVFVLVSVLGERRGAENGKARREAGLRGVEGWMGCRRLTG